ADAVRGARRARLYLDLGQQPRGSATPLNGLLKRFLNDDPLPTSRSVATLRLVYVVAFMAQVLVAALVAIAVRALAGGPPRPSDVLAWVLVALAVMQLPFAALMASRLGTINSRQAALARALFAAIILAATAWSTALALATGQTGLSVYVLLSMVMLA